MTYIYGIDKGSQDGDFTCVVKFEFDKKLAKFIVSDFQYIDNMLISKQEMEKRLKEVLQKLFK